MIVRRFESDAVREQRIRRAVAGLGYALRRSRRRKPESPDYGLFHVVDPFRNWIVAGAWPWDHSLDLDDLEAWLAESPATTDSLP